MTPGTTVAPPTVVKNNGSRAMTKWASLVPYGMTAELLRDVLPVGEPLNAGTIRNHLQAVAPKCLDRE